jgi:hypothetical protein
MTVNRLKLTMKATIVVVGVFSAQTAVAIPSVADPCPLAASLLCRFVPIAPDLDDDVDLTKQLSPAGPTAPPPESLPPTDVRAGG